MKNPFRKLFAKKAVANEFKSNSYQCQKEALLMMIKEYDGKVADYVRMKQLARLTSDAVVSDEEYCKWVADAFKQDLLLLEAKHQLEIL